MAQVAGWIWRGTNVAKDLIDWDDEFTEDGLNGRDQVRRGQRIYWWQTGPEGGIMGAGKVLGPATLQRKVGPDRPRFTFRVAITKRFLDTPVRKLAIRKTAGLARLFRIATSQQANLLRLDSKEVDALDRLIRASRIARAGAQPISATPVSSQAKGAGFGSAAANRRVERAAVRFVEGRLRSRGYSVRSVEAAKLGYDLDCADDRGLLHVEVKGVSGAQLSFPITRNEVETAARDPYFSLAVVTSALTAPRLHFYSAAQFRKRFLLTPISFMAKAK